LDSDIYGFASLFGVAFGFVGLLLVHAHFRDKRIAAKRAALKPQFLDSCRVLGLTEAEDEWWVGERDGVRVGVRWMAVMGYYRVPVWLTEYRAMFEPPLRIGAVIYGNVEVFGGVLTSVHQASASHWNELELPSGGTLRQVLKSPDEATVKHTDIGLSKGLCVYATDPAVATRVLTGPLKDRILVARDTCSNIWIDDAQVRALLHAPWGTMLANVKHGGNTEYPQHERETIEAGLTGMAILARDLQRLAS